MSRHPIADSALLSDCNGSALVRRDGTVDWLCLPRFDAPALLAGVLDDRAGHWRIGPLGEPAVSRRYLDGTLVLETRFRGDDGELVLRDALATGADDRGHDLGRGSPHLLLRTVECTAGEVELAIELAPRPEYGLIRPLLKTVAGGLLARGGASVLRLSSPVELELEGSTARARITLRQGDRLAFGLEHRRTSEEPPPPRSQADLRQRLDDTIAAWQSWSDLHQSYQGPRRELVLHSGRVLQGLTYQPTGAMVAAATTSLPETIGGERNWDYRYTWIRDASLTLDALWVAACPDEAHRFFDFIAATAVTQLGAREPLQIMFGIEGEHDLSERELTHLAGWRDSRPVRVGNDAWRQHQVDVYGELLAAAHRLRDQLTELDRGTRDFLAEVAEAAAQRWMDRDQGIWEIRGEPQHHLYSKLMCWVALDRAVKLADLLSAHDRLERWTAQRDEIRDAILTRGWSPRAGAYTQAFGSDDLDAAVLMMPIMGFVPADDERMLATIEAIEERLTDERGFVYRYQSHDGLEGDEGTFLLCTFWLAQALAMAGRVDRAFAVFETAADLANDVGLLSEEVDAATGELLGNFPQAFSHIGLINAAWAIHEARTGPPANVEGGPSVRERSQA